MTSFPEVNFNECYCNKNVYSENILKYCYGNIKKIPCIQLVIKVNEEFYLGEFIKRIKSVQKILNKNEIFILFGESLKVRNNDVEFKFRQNSNFYYLTGLNEPDAILILTKESSSIFVLPKDKNKEIWTGSRTGKDKIQKQLKLDEAYDLTEWDAKKEKLLVDYHTLYYFFGQNQNQDNEILSLCQKAARKVREGLLSPAKIIRPDFLHEMRMIKSAYEIKKISEAVAITARGHQILMSSVKSGMYEYEAEAMLEKEFLSSGAWGGGYGHIVASGKNATILHYTANNQKLNSGDLLLVDSGAEKDYYTADVTRTFPVDHKFSDAQKEIYQLVLDTQKLIIKNAVKGNTMENLHNLAVRSLTQGLLDLGVLKGGVKKNIKEKLYSKYYMHKTGHWLGMDVHDVGSYYINGSSRKLEDGMVITVEPGLYFNPDDKSIPTRYRGIGVRIEDDVLIAGKNPINLTAMIPKEIEELEELHNPK